MENFIVSARKYRPATFNSVVGQQSITTTLKNAINKNQLAHAYLFFGPRGVGKTTCARIFAKTINCSGITDETEACNKCESCLSFNESRSYNIHELDAASNNSVEDIRNLIDQVRIPPQIGNYSIYIIDEVHMLSLSAFNAFLKTLEEPPKHAIFILATTEKHKIIPTILSRCQIFDFNRIEISDIVSHLQYISDNEEVKADAEGLNVIAQKADGAMRDALSIFDQIVSFSGSEINYQAVIQNLNVLDYEYYFSLVDAFLDGDYGNALNIFNEILYKGFDGHNFISGLSKHLRDILICKDQATISLLEVGSSIKTKYQEQSAKCPVDFLLTALNINNKFDLSYKASNNSRLHVELDLLQLSSITQKKKVISAPPTQKVEREATVALVKEERIIEVKAEADIQIKAEIPDLAPLPENEPETKPPAVPEIPSFSDDVPKVEDVLNGNITENPKKEKKIEEPVIETVAVEEVKELSDEALQEHWNGYALKIKEEEPRLSSTLQNHKPVLQEDGSLKLTIANESQLKAIAKTKPYLLNYLRGQLKVNELELNLEVGETEEMEQRYYTQAEKFQFLAQKNPELNNLKKQFNLDFD
jgi:DNA polymerase III subunit gamma/tau